MYTRPYTQHVVTSARIVGPSDYGRIVGPSDIRRMSLRGAPDLNKPIVTFISLLAIGTLTIVTWSLSRD